MFRFVIALSIMFSVGSALAQRELSLPKRSGTPPDTSPQAARGDDVILLYPTRKDAGRAAFRKGYEAAGKHQTDRSIDLFLEALKREPSLTKALFNLGVECSIDGRWDDALRFYEVYQGQPDADAKVVDMEIRRVTAVSKLAPGRRAFMTEFQSLLDEKNVDLAIVKLETLSKRYPKEWEAPALLGENLARAGRFQECIEALHQAAQRRIELQSKLNSAADVAQKEVNFKIQVNNADQARQNGQYEVAGKMYLEAWNSNPAYADLVMKAATSQLMADDVDAAILSLDKARTAANPEVSLTAIRMLKPLAEISRDAALPSNAASPSNAPPPQPKATPAESIVELIGPLKTDEMMFSSQQPPKLLEEKTDVVVAPKDLKASDSNTVSEFKSTDSIFEIYQRNRDAESKQQAALADSAPSAVVADVEPSDPEPRRVQQTAVAPAVRGNSGPLQQVSITTVPPGAMVYLDQSGQDGHPQQCVSPCPPFSLVLGSRHSILVTLDGYRTVRKSFNVERGSQTIPFALEEAKGCLLLPASAGTVRVDEKKMETPRQVCVSAGQHEVSLELNGQITKKKVLVVDGQFTPIKLGQEN